MWMAVEWTVCLLKVTRMSDMPLVNNGCGTCLEAMTQASRATGRKTISSNDRLSRQIYCFIYMKTSIQKSVALD